MGAMSEVPQDFARALSRHSPAIAEAVSKVAAARDGRDYALAAYRGGDRSCFGGEREIEDHYRAVAAEARERGRGALDALLSEMRTAVDCGLRIDTAKAAEVRAALPLVRDDASLVRFVSELERRDDYTAVAAVARCCDGELLPSARRIGKALDGYEKSLSEVVRKAEKFVSKALDGDGACGENWGGWLQDNVKASESAYEALRAAVSGEPEETGGDAVFAALMAR